MFASYDQYALPAISGGFFRLIWGLSYHTEIDRCFFNWFLFIHHDGVASILCHRFVRLLFFYRYHLDCLR